MREVDDTVPGEGGKLRRDERERNASEKKFHRADDNRTARRAQSETLQLSR
jgi:hypothetical protein